MSPLEKATREHTKSHNRRLILRTIYDKGEISRVDISRQTQLTRTTVSGNVSELIDEGLVREVGIVEAVVGKPPMLLSVVEDARHLLGLDLSGGHLRGAVVNLRGKVRHEASIALSGQGGEAALEQVYALLDQLMASTDRPLLGIGIGTTGLVDTPSGVIRQAVNLDWRDLPIRDLLARRYGLPVYVANDCHVAAIAEHTFGRHKNLPNLLVIKVGWGVGMGLMLNGRLFYGDDGGAGEIGHVVVADHGPVCRCGNFGCLETVASSQAILQQARMLTIHHPGSRLSQLGGGELTMEHVMTAWREGEPLLQPLIANAGRYLGVGLAHVVGALNVRHVLIAGSVAEFGPTLLDPLAAQVRQRTLATLAAHIQIEASTLGPSIVSLGAAALLLAHELGLNQFP